MSTWSRRDFIGRATLMGSLVGAGFLKGHKVNAANVQFRGDGSTLEPQHQYYRDVAARPVFSRSSSILSSQPKPTGVFPILQGATSTTATQFRVLVETAKLYRYSIVDASGVKRLVSPRERAGVTSAKKNIDHIVVEGLEPETDYWLVIEDYTRAGILDRRQFRTLSKKHMDRAALRVALISCMNDRYVNDQGEMWQSVGMALPEVVILNGDLCYVDQRASGTIEGMWDRHVKTREMLDIFRWDRLVPTFVTWDDHDTGANDSDSTNPRIPTAGEYFDAMFGSAPVAGFKKSASRCHTLDVAGIRFAFLDDRSNKTKGLVYSSADEKWLAEQISTATGPVWVVSGMQFFGGYLMGADSVEKSAPEQLERIVKMGAQAKVPVLFMSGDVHFSEVMELEAELMGYSSFELTSSSIHSRTFPGQQFRSYNSRRRESTSRYNFMAIEMLARTSQNLDFEVACLGAGGTEFFRYRGNVLR